MRFSAENEQNRFVDIDYFVDWDEVMNKTMRASKHRHLKLVERRR